MKIIRIVSELDFGGVEQVIANSVWEMGRNSKMDVSIIVLGKGGKVAQELIEKGIQVDVLNQNPRIPNFRLIFKLRKIILESNPAVLHSQGGEANFHGILAGSWAGVKRIVGEEIGIPNHHSYWKYIFKWVYSRAHVIIAISEAVKNAIVGLGEVEKEKVRVVYNPVRLENGKIGNRVLETPIATSGGSNSFRKKNKEEKPFVYITTCRLVPIKNLERLIAAFSELVKEYEEKPMELWIVGDGPLIKHLIKKVNKSGLINRVKFLGFQENVFQFLKLADVFTLPSLKEGSSVSLVEAMVCGLPSVVTKIGGAAEILGSSKSGVLVDPLDVSLIKEGMYTLATMTDLERKEMGERAKAEAERFYPEKYLKSLKEIYKG
ncbi:MAG: glycosyltransferase [Cyclobacteriaceae bacterium]